MKHSISELLQYISVRNIRNCVFHIKKNSRPIYCLVRPSVLPTSHLTLTVRSRHPEQTCTHLVVTNCNGDSQRRTSELYVAPAVCRNTPVASTQFWKLPPSVSPSSHILQNARPSSKPFTDEKKVKALLAPMLPNCRKSNAFWKAPGFAQWY